MRGRYRGTIGSIELRRNALEMSPTCPFIIPPAERTTTTYDVWRDMKCVVPRGGLLPGVPAESPVIAYLSGFTRELVGYAGKTGHGKGRSTASRLSDHIRCTARANCPEKRGEEEEMGNKKADDRVVCLRVL